MGVHGVVNVLLWYCQIIKKEVRDEPLFLITYFLAMSYNNNNSIKEARNYVKDI